MAEEEGRVGEWKKLGSFPQCTSADRRKMESRGGGQRVLQSGGEGWDRMPRGRDWGGGEGIGGMSDTSVSQGCPHSTEHAAIAATNLQQGGENRRGQPGNLRCF